MSPWTVAIPPPDLPIGYLAALSAYLIMALVLLVLVIMLEAFLLRLFEYGSFWICLLASLLMNVASAFIGYIVGVNSRLVDSAEVLYYGGKIDFRSFNYRLPSVLLFLLISWMVSVVSEGGMLTLIGGMLKLIGPVHCRRYAELDNHSGLEQNAFWLDQ